MSTATFAAGCFWGVEAVFAAIPGVTKTTVGYEGGHTANPAYEEVYADKTGHAEVIQIEFDPARVSYEELLQIFWDHHDPTTINQQGLDFGTRYRSVIFYHDDEQREMAEVSKAAEQTQWSRPIVTEIEPATTFYPAEEYHQRYCEKNAVVCHMKVKKS